MVYKMFKSFQFILTFNQDVESLNAKDLESTMYQLLEGKIFSEKDLELLQVYTIQMQTTKHGL